MSSAKEMLSGVFSPMCTPFINDEISYEGVKNNILLMNKSGLKDILFWVQTGSLKLFQKRKNSRCLKLFLKIQLMIK